MPTRTAVPTSLAADICRGITEGNRPLAEAITGYGKSVHELRGQVQINVDKLYSLDSEVKLLKGFIVSLQGTGDGSSGSVPQLQKDVRALGDNINVLKGDMGSVRSDISTIMSSINAMRLEQTTQRDLANTVKGGAWTAKFLIGTCIAALGTMATVLTYLFTHGLKP